MEPPQGCPSVTDLPLPKRQGTPDASGTRSGGTEGGAPERHFIPPHTAEEFEKIPVPDEEYVPENALIRSVKIYRWKNSYRYYDAFVRDAVRLYPVHGVPCDHIPFFSYVPQYSQLNRQQLEWYLWWRERARNGEYLQNDYSYLILYCYEQINLSDRIDPRDAQRALYEVWLNYRTIYYQLDSMLPEWICDMGLLHKLPPPASLTGQTLAKLMGHCALKEYYVPPLGGDGYLRVLLAFCSNYDYQNSKFYTSETAEIYDTAVMSALGEVVTRFSGEGKLFRSAGLDDSKMIRDVFTGALCAYRIKRRVEIGYCSFSRSHELRFVITDIVKYTENQIRAALGIRSRLTVYSLPDKVREVLDGMLPKILPERRTAGTKKEEPVPDYEKNYDLPQKSLSISDAARIESESWSTTEKLIAAFGDTPEEEPEPTIPPIPEPEPAEADGDTSGGAALLPYFPFLRAVLDGDTAGQKQAAVNLGKLPDAVADEINGIAVDETGDILLEETDRGYGVIEDYRQMTETLLQKGDGQI